MNHSITRTMNDGTVYVRTYDDTENGYVRVHTYTNDKPTGHAEYTYKQAWDEFTEYQMDDRWATTTIAPMCAP